MFTVLEWAQRWRRTTTAGDTPAAKGSHFTLLVADLDGDDVKGSQTKHLVRSLRDHRGIRVLRFTRALKVKESGDTTERREAAEDLGREWLRQKNADILIWGEVVADGLLHIRFLSRQGPEGSSGQDYRLGEEFLRLPEDFDEEISAQVVAYALSASGIAVDERGSYIVPVLRPLTEKLRRLIESPPEGFDA